MSTLGSLVGIAGSALCSFGMVAAALGLFAAGGTVAGRAASMPGMGTMGRSGGNALPGWLDALVRFGPPILIGSVVLLAVAVVVRRPIALLPAVAGGLVLYVGMYVQQSVVGMCAAIGVGMLLLALSYVASLRPSPGAVVPVAKP